MGERNFKRISSTTSAARSSSAIAAFNPSGRDETPQLQAPLGTFAVRRRLASSWTGATTILAASDL
jgi:hypothetical protein